MPSPHPPGVERRRPENAALRARQIVVADDWLARCATRVRRHDPAIAAVDADELARFMYCQDRYRRLPPERAVDTLFAAQQSQRRA